jgi:Insertion element 4 transposase N-terminal/Transposase DDE domain
MPSTIRSLDPNCKPADYLTLPQLETILAPQVIQEVLSDCDAWEQREKKLNMQAMVYLLIALALYPQCSTREVYRRLLEGLGELARSPFPQARCVLLMACGTHVIFDAEFTAVQQGELGSVLTLIERSLRAAMLLLCDAGICSGPVLVAARNKGAHVLGRIDSRSWAKPWGRLHDGSYLVKVYRDGRHRSGESVTARVIEYRVKDPQTGHLSKPVRLITTLLDPYQYPIEALIRLYHERWELEQGIDEIKTHLCVSARTLRSQTPQGVEQELYAILLAYFAVRTLMYAAALHADWDPDEVSFVQTLNVIQRSQWPLMQADSFQRPALRQALLHEVCQERVPPRRLRLQARVVKRTHSRYKRKWYAHLHAPCLHASFLDLVILLN